MPRRARSANRWTAASWPTARTTRSTRCRTDRPLGRHVLLDDGRAVRIEGDDCEPIEAPNLPFVVGFDGGAGDTGELVAGVGELREEYGFAADTVESIGDVVRTGEKLLADAVSEADPSPELLAELGELMDFNHGLLSALGVSARSLDAMVWAARDAGAHGAKLTGAGGGGCIVALSTRATRARPRSPSRTGARRRSARSSRPRVSGWWSRERGSRGVWDGADR